MVAVVSGSGLGLVNTSRDLVGAGGQWGQAALGRAGEGVSVNAATGNLVLQNRDEFLVGVGPDADLLRTYNSRGGWDGDNGDNWRIGYYRRVAGLSGSVNTAGSSIVRVDADGFESTYTYDGTRYVGRDGSGSYDWLTYNSGTSTWSWTDGDTGNVETYAETSAGSGSFRLTRVNDPEGHGVRVTYDAAGLISTIATWRSGASAADETITLTYDNATNRRLTQIVTTYLNEQGVTATRSRVRYEYDSSGRLAAVRTDLSPEDGVVADGRVYSVLYGYDASGRVNSVTQSDGSSLAIVYDGSGRVTQLTDALGHVTNVSYDAANRRTTVTDPLGQATVLTHDNADRLIGSSGAALGGGGFSRAFTYNANGDLITARDAQGAETTFAYTANGALQRVTDAAGNVVERSYDSANRLLAATAFTVPDPDGVAGSGVAAGSLQTRYVYDTTGGLRRLRFEVSAQGRVTQYEYNTLGQRSVATEYVNGAYTTAGSPTVTDLTSWVSSLSASDRASVERKEFSYDLRGHVTTIRSYAANTVAGSSVTYGGMTQQSFVYDAFGRLLRSVDANANGTVFTYDGMGRVLATTDSRNVTTLRSYDDAGNRTSIQYANGLTTVSTFNRAGLLVAEARMQGAANLGETRYFYDAADRLVMTQDASGLRQWMFYDPAGRKTADLDAAGRFIEYVHDGDGRLVQSIAYATPVAASVVASMVDGSGNPVARPLAAVRPAADGTGDRVATRFYDAAGRLAATQDGDGYVVESLYDGASRVVATIAYATASAISRIDTSSGSTVSIVPTLASVRPSASATGDRRVRSFYDADGLLRATLDGEGYLTEMRYDGAARLVERIAYANATDPAQRAAGTLAQLLPATNATDRREVWLYDGKGQVRGEVDAEGYLTEFVYDGQGNRTQSIRYATLVSAAVTPTSALTALRPASTANDRSALWAYDELNRVRSETAADGTSTQYEYDNVGHLLRTTRAAGRPEARTLTTRYDVQGRVTADLSAEGAALLTGGQTQAEIDAIWQSYGNAYSYDGAGRLLSSRDARGSTTVRYYDTTGREVYRILKTATGGEVSRTTYNAFGQVASSAVLANRLSLADTTPLTGGQVDASLTAKIDALTDTSRDLRSSTSYNRRSQIQQAIDALGNRTDHVFDAFGGAVTTTADVDSTRRTSTQQLFDRRGLLTRVDQDGIAATNEYDAFGRVVATVDARGYRTTTSFVRNDGGSDGGRKVVVTDPSGAARTTAYDAFDRVLTQTDVLGRSVRYAYDTANRTVTMTTAEGIVTTTESTRHGEVLRVTDGTGATTAYAYDRNGKLLTVTDALGNVTRNDYDAVGNLLTHIEGLARDGNGALINDGSATATVYTYDAANRVLSRRVDPNGLNLQTSYQYDGRGKAIRQTDAAGVATTYAFDAKGQLSLVTVDDVPGGLQLRTAYAYDAQGRKLSVTEGAGTSAAKTTEYRYDTLGRRIEEIVDPAGLRLSTRYEYDEAGHVVLKRDGLNNATRFVYDALGRLRDVIDATGGVTRNTYDAAGRLTATKDYARRFGSPPLDLSRGALTDAQVASTIASLDSAADALKQYAYDRDGRQTYAIDAEGGVTAMRYDAAGRVVETTRYATRQPGPWSASSAPVADAARDQSTLTVYDAAGRARFSVDALNFVTESVFDRQGNVARTTRYANSISRPAQATEAAVTAAVAGDSTRDRVEHALYDAASRLSYAVDAEGYVTQYVRDGLGRVTDTLRSNDRIDLSQVPTVGQVSPLGGTISSFASGAEQASGDAFVWDPAGGGRLRLSGGSSGGYYVGYVGGEWPPAYRMGSILSVDVTPVNTDVHTETLIEGNVTNGWSRALVAFDRGGAIRFEINNGETNENLQIEAGTYVPGVTYRVEFATTATTITLYVYDATRSRDSGSVYRFQKPHSWQSFRNSYFAVHNGNPSGEGARVDNHVYQQAVRSTDVFDAAGRRTASIDAEGVITRYAYDASGRVVDETFASGLAESSTTHHAYDGAGRLIETTTASGTSESATTRYRYDANGRLTETIEARGIALAESEGTWAVSERQALGYPAQAADLSTAQRQALLDRFTTRFGYDAAGRKTTVIDTLGSVSTTTFDAFGRAVAVNLQNGLYSRTEYAFYDRLGRVAQRVDGERYLTTNAYDAFGNLTDTVRYDARVSGALAAQSSTSPGIAVGAADPGNGMPFVIAASAHDATQHTEFDRRNQMLWQRDAEGYVEGTLQALDAFGQRQSVVNRTGYQASYLHDRLGRVVQETLPITSFDAGGREHAVVNQHTYDSRGNRIQTREAVDLPEERITDFRFDNMNRLVWKTSPSYLAIDGSEIRPSDLYRYDARGNMVEQILGADDAWFGVNGGRRSRAWYDAQGRKTAEVSADAVLARYTYDAAGNLAMHRILATRLDEVPSNPTSGVPTVAATADDRTLTFVYDALGRKTETRLDGVWTWENGEPVAIPEAQRISIERLGYDAAGNVVQRTDARGNSSYSYFDGIGRQILAVDAGGYTTAWDYHRSGKVATVETRYAGRIASTVARQNDAAAAEAARDPASLRNAAAAATAAMPAAVAEADRVTTFALDRLDRVVAKSVLDVQYEHVQNDGGLVQRMANAITQYVYDGLGHVTRINERVAELADNLTNVWETTDIAYDGLGREVSRQAPGFVDYLGATVRPRTDTQYDGVGNVVRRVQRDVDDSNESGDRITRYAYDHSGHIAQETDAEGGIARYAYNAFGDIVQKTSVAVRRSDGSSRDLVTRYERDAAGRISVETDVDTGDVRKTRYTAFGEVAAKGNGDGWQEFAEYTTLGKVWKTNSGDGVVKIYLHDRNGNTTREIKAADAVDLRSIDIRTASADETLFNTISLYDARNLLTQSIDPQIGLLGNTVSLSRQLTEQWVAQYGDLNIAQNQGGYANLSVGQGTAYTTIGTSVGTGRTLSPSVPFTTAGSTGIALEAPPVPIGLPEIAPLRWPALTNPIDRRMVNTTSAGVSNWTTTFSIPPSWPAGNYRVTETRGTTITVLSETSAGSRVWQTGVGSAGTRYLSVEYQVTGDEPWSSIASLSYDKDVEIEDLVVFEKPFRRPVIVTFSAATIAYQSDGILVFDRLATQWNAAYFSVVLDPGLPSATNLETREFSPDKTVIAPPPGKPYVRASARLQGVELPAGLTGAHTLRVLGFDGAGNLVSGTTFQLGSDYPGAPADAASLGQPTTIERGNYGYAWAEFTGGERMLVIDVGQAGNSAGVFRYRPLGSDPQAPWSEVPFWQSAVDLVGLALSDSTAYEFVIGYDNDTAYRYGTLRTEGSGVWGGLEVEGKLRALYRGPESMTISANSGDTVTFRLGGLETTRVASGDVTIDLAAEFRPQLGIGLWGSASQPYEVVVTDAAGVVQRADHGVITFGTSIDTGSGPDAALRTAFVRGSGDQMDEFAAEGLIRIAGAAGRLTLTPSGGAPVTVELGSTSTIVHRDPNDPDNWIVNLRGWLPAYGSGSIGTIDWRYDGNDGLVSTGAFTVTERGEITGAYKYGQTTGDPRLPLTLPAGSSLSVFRVGASGGALADAMAEIAGSGASTIWDVSQRLGQTVDYYFEAVRDGVLVARGQGQVVVNANGSTSQTFGTAFNIPDVSFEPPLGTASFALRIKPRGSSESPAPFTTLRQPVGADNAWVFNFEALVPASDSTQWDYEFEATRADGEVLSRGTGVLSIDSSGATATSKELQHRPVPVLFKLQRPAASALLRVTNLSTGSFSTPALTGEWVAPLLNPDGSVQVAGYTRFSWDSAMPGNEAGSYDYELIPQDASGTPLNDEAGQPIRQTGRVVLDPSGAQPVRLLEQVTGFNQSDGIFVSRLQSHNAFGEVVEERDERVAERMAAMLGLSGAGALDAEQLQGARTTLRYNTLGQLIAKADPLTHVTLANGYRLRERPTTRYGYDLLGRVASTTDANGNQSRQSLLAGSRGQSGAPSAEFFADGGVRRSGYDVFGDARVLIDQEGGLVEQTYDKLSHLIGTQRTVQSVTDGNGSTAAIDLTTAYGYDQLGRRLSQTDAAGNTLRTDYDGLGRVTRTVSAEGFATAYQYENRAAGAADPVLGVADRNIGGIRRTTIEADGRRTVDKIDHFGRTTWHQDLSGMQTTYRYDSGGRLVNQTSTVHTGQTLGQNISYTYYANGYLQSMTDRTMGTISEYAYDNAGNRTYEGYFQGVQGAADGAGFTKNGSYQSAAITYDELNRIARVYDRNYFDIRYEYDAVGNRRLVDSVYWDGMGGLRGNGGSLGGHQTYWYDYDSMNRFVVTLGTLSGARATSADDTGVRVVAGAEGTVLHYDHLSRRTRAQYTQGERAVDEIYGYRADGFLQTITDAAAGPQPAAVRVLDAVGRTVQYHDNRNRIVTTTAYDRDGRTLSQGTADAVKPENDGTTTYSYYGAADPDGRDTLAAASASGAGALARTVFTPTSGGNATTITTTYGYDYWDEAKQQSVLKSAANTGAPNWRPGQTILVYNANGHLRSNVDVVARLTTAYFNNAAGLVLRREKTQATGSQTTTPVGSHHYYYADGRRIGDVSDEPGDNTRVSYAEQLAAKRQEAPDRKTLYRTFKPVTSADFDQNYEPINESYPQATGSSYTIRGGEDLQAVAQSLWGDRALWYLIAEANGLSGDESLTAGQVLAIPNKVTNIHNNAETFRPYSAGEAIGKIDPTLPSAPPPPTQAAGKKGCGAIGQVIMIVVAVVVTYYTGGAASEAFAGYFGSSAATTAAGYAVGAAAGSIASQGAGMAMGNQQNFSWNAVGQAAIAGAIGGGISAANPGAAAGLSGSEAAAANAAIASGVNMAIHNDWNWTVVLASAIGAGVGQAAGQAFADNFGYAANTWQNQLVSGFAGGVAGGAASGESVRFDSVFASTLGSVIGTSISQQLSGPSYSAEEMAGDYTRENNRFAARAVASGGGASRWDMGSTDYSLASGSRARFTGNVEPTAEELQASFRASEREYRSTNEASVSGAGYVARSGDSISSIVGSSRPQDIGNFMRANGLSSDRIEVGRNYFVPESTTAYGDSASLGQYALNQGNERIAAASRSEMQRELNRFAAATSEASGASPVWNMRDASAASRLQAQRDYESGLASLPGQYVGPVDVAAQRAATVRRESLLNFLGGQGSMALGGVVSAGVMLGTGNVVAASATTDAVAPLDNLLAPMGGGAASRMGSSARVRGVSGSPSPMLPSEGNVGTYDDLIAAGTKGDNVTPHHIPSARHMGQYGIPRGDGITLNMEMPSPGSGGRHRDTFTYGNNADVDMSSRDALAAGIRDARSIYQRDGLYDAYLRQQLQDVIRQNRATYPEVFKKP